MIAELQDERQRLDEAIEALERLSASSRNRRRGRPARGSKQADQPPQANEKISAAFAQREKSGLS